MQKVKKYNKIIALALLASVVGTQYSTIQAVSAQTSTNNLPALADKTTTHDNETNLPKINLTPYEQNQLQQTSPLNDYSGQPLKGQVTTIPAGTSFTATINSNVSSNISKLGEVVTATINDAVAVDGNVIIPQGSEAIGQITYVDGAGRAGKDGAIDLRFTSIKLPNGQRIPLTGKIQTIDKSGSLKGGSWKKQVVTGVGTTAVATGAGSLLGLTSGAIVGVPAKLTLFGTALGGFLGLGYVLARKGKEAMLPSGAQVNITLDQPASIGR